MLAADARQKIALVVDDRNTRAKIWVVAIGARCRAQFANIADGAGAVWHEDAAGPVQVVELRLVSTVAVEYLDAMILTVGDVDPAVGVAGNIMHQIELAWLGSRLSPRHQQLPVGGVLVHAGVAVTVRYVNLALGRQRGMRATVERLSAHERRRFAGRPKRQQN